VLEGDVEVLAKDVEHAATLQHFKSLGELIELKLEMVRASSKAAADALREELIPLKRAVYGLIAVILVTVIAALMRGVLK